MDSPLASYTHYDADTYGVRDHVIDTISIHCYACQVTGKRGVEGLIERKSASANYVIGYDGVIGCNVPENKGSICTCSRSNDMRAITIEVACEPTAPYKVTDAAMTALINLLVDCCKRNKIPELRWKADKSLIGQVSKQNMTVHRWFANKACPGDYLYEKHYWIASTVNAILKSEKEGEEMTQEQFNKMMDNYLAAKNTKAGSSWSEEARDWAIKNKVFAGDGKGNFKWQGFVTREQVAQILMNEWELIETVANKAGVDEDKLFDEFKKKLKVKVNIE